MDKIIRVGRTKDCGDVFCRIQFKNDCLSITGVEGPKANGDARGSCGQISMNYRPAEEQDRIDPAPGWAREAIVEFFVAWDRWHLNDMRAGSPVQMAYLREHASEFRDTRTWEASWDLLTAAGLNPDPEGYHYGSAWRMEPIPASVLAYFASLPDSDITPAWV